MIQEYYMHFPDSDQEVQLLEEVLTDNGDADRAELLVYNDDHNTFDWVIECFIDILKHTQEQSEQLAMLIHFKGKASVKSASKMRLLPYKEALVDRGLSAVIEDVG